MLTSQKKAFPIRNIFVIAIGIALLMGIVLFIGGADLFPEAALMWLAFLSFILSTVLWVCS